MDWSYIPNVKPGIDNKHTLPNIWWSQEGMSGNEVKKLTHFGITCID